MIFCERETSVSQLQSEMYELVVLDDDDTECFIPRVTQITWYLISYIPVFVVQKRIPGPANYRASNTNLSYQMPSAHKETGAKKSSWSGDAVEVRPQSQQNTFSSQCHNTWPIKMVGIRQGTSVLTQL